jgi:alpha-glucosidase
MEGFRLRWYRGNVTAELSAHGPARPWWEPGVIYQVYPRSFQDANGDGTGDLEGIRLRLDHLEWLGVDAIWLSPIFRSPMADFGYDVADYCDVDPLFGSMADLDRLVADAHSRNIRVLLDFVPNHTSDRHAWFVEARSSRDNPRRDWYIWRDPAPSGGPPNNLRSQFGGSAWTLDEPTGQYWFHTFLAEQPELDWRNPAVRAAMLDVLRFWFGRGIDGFRIDVLWLIAKDDAPWSDRLFRPLADPPEIGRLDSDMAIEHGDGPDMDARLRELRAVAEESGGRLLVGEIYLPPSRLARYYGSDGQGVQLPFNFGLVTEPWDARGIEAGVAAYEAALPPGGWPNWVVGNHDQSRVASRVGRAQARVAAMLVLTLRGTPTLYQGDEIGMTDVDIPEDRLRDPARRRGDGHGRDPERTPMQWDGSANAGFTTGEPWLPLAPDADTVNVETQRADPRSILTLHRRLIQLRRAQPVLAVGDYEPVAASGDLLAYRRRLGAAVRLVALNLGPAPASLALPGNERYRVALSTGLDREGEPVSGDVRLAGDEGLVLEPAS